MSSKAIWYLCVRKNTFLHVLIYSRQRHARFNINDAKCHWCLITDHDGPNVNYTYLNCTDCMPHYETSISSHWLSNVWLQMTWILALKSYGLLLFVLFLYLTFAHHQMHFSWFIWAMNILLVNKKCKML